MQEQLPRNLYTLDKAKISPVGRNDINNICNSTFNGAIVIIYAWAGMYLKCLEHGEDHRYTSRSRSRN